jgi:hypothetical protein
MAVEPWTDRRTDVRAGGIIVLLASIKLAEYSLDTHNVLNNISRQ